MICGHTSSFIGVSRIQRQTINCIEQIVSNWKVNYTYFHCGDQISITEVIL